MKRKGKKCNLKEEINQATEVNSLPIHSRRETRNSTKAAMSKQKENPDEPIEDNKRQLMYVVLIHYQYIL